MPKKILLIEDDPPKRNQIINLIGSLNLKITHAHSVNEAIRRIDEDRFDGILLDMSLPTFNEGLNVSSSGRQQDFGGRQILTYMWELEYSSKVLLVTQLPGFKTEKGKEIKLKELDESLTVEFKGLYTGFVYFTHSSDAWAQRIKDFLANL
jgi:CheY-like chemotaxis protein